MIGLTRKMVLARKKYRFFIFPLCGLLIFDLHHGWPLFQREVTIGWVGTMNSWLFGFDRKYLPQAVGNRLLNSRICYHWALSKWKVLSDLQEETENFRALNFLLLAW